MDLNHLYSQHQLSLMRAEASSSGTARTKHLAAADLFASRIGSYQLAEGAVAAAGWLRDMENPERRAEARGLST